MILSSMTSNTGGESNFWVTGNLYLIGRGITGVPCHDSCGLTLKGHCTYNNAKNGLEQLSHIPRSVLAVYLGTKHHLNNLQLAKYFKLRNIELTVLFFYISISS